MINFQVKNGARNKKATYLCPYQIVSYQVQIIWSNLANMSWIGCGSWMAISKGQAIQSFMFSPPLFPMMEDQNIKKSETSFWRCVRIDKTQCVNGLIRRRLFITYLYHNYLNMVLNLIDACTANHKIFPLSNFISKVRTQLIFRQKWLMKTIYDIFVHVHKIFPHSNCNLKVRIQALFWL